MVILIKKGKLEGKRRKSRNKKDEEAERQKRKRTYQKDEEAAAEDQEAYERTGRV